MANIKNNSIGPGSGGIENYQDGEEFNATVAQRPITNLVTNDQAINNHLKEISNFLKDGIVNGNGTNFTITLDTNNDPEMIFQVNTGMAIIKKLNPVLTTTQNITIDISTIPASNKRRDLIYINTSSVVQVVEGSVQTVTPPDYAQSDVPKFQPTDTIPSGFAVGDDKGILIGSILFERNGAGNLIGSGTITQATNYASLGDEALSAISGLFGVGIFQGIDNEFEPSVSGFFYTVDSGEALVGDGVANLDSSVSINLPRSEIIVGTGSPSLANGWEAVDFTGGPTQVVVQGGIYELDETVQVYNTTGTTSYTVNYDIGDSVSSDYTVVVTTGQIRKNPSATETQVLVKYVGSKNIRYLPYITSDGGISFISKTPTYPALPAEFVSGDVPAGGIGLKSILNRAGSSSLNAVDFGIDLRVYMNFKLVNGKLDAGNVIELGTIIAGLYAAGSITGDDIANDTISNDNLTPALRDSLSSLLLTLGGGTEGYGSGGSFQFLDEEKQLVNLAGDNLDETNPELSSPANRIVKSVETFVSATNLTTVSTNNFNTFNATTADIGNLTATQYTVDTISLFIKTITNPLAAVEVVVEIYDVLAAGVIATSTAKPSNTLIPEAWNNFTFSATVLDFGKSYEVRVKRQGTGPSTVIPIGSAGSGGSAGSNIMFRTWYKPVAGNYGTSVKLLDAYGDISIPSAERLAAEKFFYYIPYAVNMGTGGLSGFQVYQEAGANNYVAIDVVNGFYKFAPNQQPISRVSFEAIFNQGMTQLSSARIYREPRDPGSARIHESVEHAIERLETSGTSTHIEPRVDGQERLYIVEERIGKFQFSSENRNLTNQEGVNLITSDANLINPLNLTDQKNVPVISMAENGEDYVVPNQFEGQSSASTYLKYTAIIDEDYIVIGTKKYEFDITDGGSPGLADGTAVAVNILTADDIDTRWAKFVVAFNGNNDGSATVAHDTVNNIITITATASGIAGNAVNAYIKDASMYSAPNSIIGIGSGTLTGGGPNQNSWSIIPRFSTHSGVLVYVSDVGSGYNSIDIAIIEDAHGVNDSDAAPGTNEIGLVAKPISEITTGWNFFTLSAAVTPGSTYHYHIRYSGTGTAPKITRDVDTSAIFFRQTYLPESGLYGTEGGYTVFDREGDITIGSDSRGIVVDNSQQISTGTIDDYQLQPSLDEINGRWPNFTPSGVATTFTTGFSILFTEVDNINDIGIPFTIELHDESNNVIGTGTGNVPSVISEPVEVFVDIDVSISNTKSYHIHVFTNSPTAGNVFVATNGNLTTGKWYKQFVSQAFVPFSLDITDDIWNAADWDFSEPFTFAVDVVRGRILFNPVELPVLKQFLGANFNLSTPVLELQTDTIVRPNTETQENYNRRNVHFAEFDGAVVDGKFLNRNFVQNELTLSKRNLDPLTSPDFNSPAQHATIGSYSNDIYGTGTNTVLATPILLGTFQTNAIDGEEFIGLDIHILRNNGGSATDYDLNIDIEDESVTSIGDVTIKAANVRDGWNFFDFSSLGILLNPGEDYKVRITASTGVAGTLPIVSTNNDDTQFAYREWYKPIAGIYGTNDGVTIRDTFGDLAQFSPERFRETDHPQELFRNELPFDNKKVSFAQYNNNTATDDITDYMTLYNADDFAVDAESVKIDFMKVVEYGRKTYKFYIMSKRVRVKDSNNDNGFKVLSDVFCVEGDRVRRLTHNAYTLDSTGTVFAKTNRKIAMDVEANNNGIAMIAIMEADGTALNDNDEYSVTETPTVVDATGDIAADSGVSIAIDTKGFVHMSYFDSTNGNLKYATNASGSFAVSTIDNDANTIGEYSSIAIDADNVVHVVYYDQTDSDLKYATNASGSFVASTIYSSGDDVGSYASIAIDHDGYLHISSANVTTNELLYTTNSSGAFVTTVADDGDGDSVGTETSIAVDVEGNVHITHFNTTNAALRYTNNTSGTFESSEVDDQAFEVGRESSLAIDSEGYLHVSHVGYGTGVVRYSTNKTGSWITSTVGATGLSPIRKSSIAVDFDGYIYISFTAASGTDLKYITNKFGAFAETTITDANSVGHFSSIAIDDNNELNIAYSDQTDSGITYVKLIKDNITVNLRNYVFFYDLEKMEKYGVELLDGNGILKPDYEKRYVLEHAVTSGDYNATPFDFDIDRLKNICSIAWTTPIRCALNDNLSFAVMWSQKDVTNFDTIFKAYLYQTGEFVDVSTIENNRRFARQVVGLSMIPKVGKLFWISNSDILCHGFEAAVAEQPYMIYDVFNVDTEQFSTGVVSTFGTRPKINSTNHNITISGFDTQKWNDRIVTAYIARESGENVIKLYTFLSETEQYDSGFEVFAAGEGAANIIDLRLALLGIWDSQATIVFKKTNGKTRGIISAVVDLESQKRISLIEEINYTQFPEQPLKLQFDSFAISNMTLDRQGTFDFYLPITNCGCFERIRTSAGTAPMLVSDKLDSTGMFVETHDFVSPNAYNDNDESYKHSVYSAQAGKYVVTVWQESRYKVFEQHAADGYSLQTFGTRGNFFVNQCYMRVFDMDREEFVTNTIQLDSATFNEADPLNTANFSVRNPFISIKGDKVYVSYVKEKHARVIVDYDNTAGVFTGGNTSLDIDSTVYAIADTATADLNLSALRTWMNTLTTSVANTNDRAGILFRTAWINEAGDATADNGKFVVFFDTPENGNGISISITNDSNSVLLVNGTSPSSTFSNGSASEINVREFDLETMDWTSRSIPAVSQTGFDYYSPRTVVYQNKVMLSFIERDFNDATAADKHYLQVSYRFYDLVNDAWATKTAFSNQADFTVLGNTPSYAECVKLYANRSKGLLLEQSVLNVLLVHPIDKNEKLYWNKLLKVDDQLQGDEELTTESGELRQFEHALHSLYVDKINEIGYASIVNEDLLTSGKSIESVGIINMSENTQTIDLANFAGMEISATNSTIVDLPSRKNDGATSRSLVKVGNELYKIDAATHSTTFEEEGIVFNEILTEKSITSGFQVSRRNSQAIYNPLYNDISSSPVIWKDKVFYAWSEKRISSNGDGTLEPYFAVVCKVMSGIKASSGTNKYNKKTMFFGENSFEFSEISDGYRAGEVLQGRYNIKATTQYAAPDVFVTENGISIEEEIHNRNKANLPMEGFETEYLVTNESSDVSEREAVIVINPGRCVDSTGLHEIVLNGRLIIENKFIRDTDMFNGHDQLNTVAHSRNSVVADETDMEPVVNPYTHHYDDKFPYIESTIFSNVVYIYIGKNSETGELKAFFDTRETPSVSGVDVFRKIGWVVVGHDRAANSSTSLGGYIVPFKSSGKGRTKKWNLYLSSRTKKFEGEITSTVLYDKEMYSIGSTFEPQILGATSSIGGDLRMKWPVPAPPGARIKVQPAYADNLLATTAIEMEVNEKAAVIQGFNFSKGKSYSFDATVDRNSMIDIVLQSTLLTDEVDVFYVDIEGDIEYDL